MNKEYDLAIAYRIYPKISKVPPIYPDDKFKLSELCLASLVKSLGNLSVKWFVILDDCPKEYKTMFEKYLNKYDTDYIETQVKSNGATFGMQMDLLLSQNHCDVIYFAEDDYFYLPDTFHELMSALNTTGIDFISPYDHLDLYTNEFHNRKYFVKFIGKRHWRSCGSTTMTFLTTKKALKSAEKVFRSYVRKNYDSSLWLTLTHENVNSPLRFMKLLIKDNQTLRIFAKAWIYTPLQVIFGKKYQLFTPIPSIAQHLDNQCMAPGIDWNSKFKEGHQWLIK
ncbi:MAG: glycosyltransferase family 2 protein [Candidatus Kapabacteria bacterium]|nr:glycosyltransferase family 2 protein [Ignavibacteriota bacterium]MCW5885821.1 glycosyltransferase family 2 protein [Candidatus Kapabacteria bacterium]